MTLLVVAFEAVWIGVVFAVSRAGMQKRLRRERTSDTSQMFKDYFAPSNVPDRMLEVVYKNLSNEILGETVSGASNGLA